MMRDICARFKYTERDADAAASVAAVVVATTPSTPRGGAPAAVTATAVASGSVPTVTEASSSDSSGERESASPTPRRVGPALPMPTPSDCPPRELIHKSLRRYYSEMESGTVTLAGVSERIRDELAPYSVLKLGGFSLGNVAPKILGTILVQSRNLRTLDLGFNRITDRGAVLLARALEQNASLASLYLSGNDIGPPGVAALATALAKNTALQSLHLSGNNIGEDGAKELADGLRQNTGLRSLYIGTNGIGSKGMECLAQALQVNQHLEELTLGQNKMGSEGMKHLATAFATGTVQLTTLEIGKNGVEADGVIALAKALCSAPNRLQNLYIDNNPIGDVGASAFGALLAKNAVLRVLDLSYTQMSLLGLRELGVGLSYSVSLLCLLLDGHDWASTQYMKKTNGLNGMSLSAKGASNFAASCIVGGINANPKSVLYKLTGVDLTLALSSLPLSSADRQMLVGDGDSSHNGARRTMDLLSRNERVLKFLRQQRIPLTTLKRKSSDDQVESPANGIEDGVAEPQSQRQKVNSENRRQSLTVSTDMPPRDPSRSSRTGLVGLSGARSVPLSSKSPPSRPPIPRHPSWPAEKRLALKSPRYESTMEVQVRKVISDIAKMPFSADEYAALQTFYLGGCTSPKTPKPRVEGDEANQESPSSSSESLPLRMKEQVPCPACRSSRLARYPRTMVLKAQMESKREPESSLLVLLRQLHYLVGVFQHIEKADEKIDALLVSVHSIMS